MIAVSNSISSRLVFSSESIEMLAIELNISPKVLLCFLYVPPSSCPTYLASVLSTINSLSTNNDIIIAGDFNLPDINWHNLTASSPFSSSLCDVVFAKNLQQIVLEPTHIHGNILDIHAHNEFR